uniref:Uncharacterized protein n=1 Tax=Globodera rostochiensis TaxID=31243 RepID=A0A914IFQ2_GLORO
MSATFADGYLRTDICGRTFADGYLRTDICGPPGWRTPATAEWLATQLEGRGGWRTPAPITAATPLEGRGCWRNPCPHRMLAPAGGEGALRMTPCPQHKWLATPLEGRGAGGPLPSPQNGHPLRWRGRALIDIDQFLSNRENVELLYLMFSRMLDRKIEEMQKARLDAGWEDDVKDDYMGIIGSTNKQVENGSICTQRLRKPTKFLLRRESSLPNRTTRLMMNGTMVDGTKDATLAARNGIEPTNRSRPQRKLSLPLPTRHLQWRVARQESERVNAWETNGPKIDGNKSGQ